MERSFSELWRISSLVYREAVFQGFYGLKRGGRLPEAKSPTDLRTLTKWNTAVTKIITTVFLGGAVAMMALLPGKASFPGVSPAAGAAVAAGMVLLAVFFIIAVMSLDLVTGFVAAKALQTLVLLPLTKRETAAVSLLGFARLFDLQLITALLASGLIYLLRTGSPAGTLAYLAGMITAESFAVAAALFLAEVFYAKVLHRPGGGLGKNLVRTVYLLGSVMPGVGMFLLFSYQAQLGKALVGALAARPELAGFLRFVYPMSFGFLTAAATGLRGATGGMLAGAGAASAVYTGLAVLALRWAAARLRSRALGGTAGAPGERAAAKHFRIKPAAPWLGILLKDLRLAFRSPSEAAFLLMPAAAVIPWAATMGAEGRLLMTARPLAAFVGFMCLSTAAILYSVEAVGESFLRTLPVRQRWILAAKAAAAGAGYLVSMLIVVAIAAVAGRGETGRLILQAAAGLAPTAAGALVTVSVLARRAGRGRGKTSPFLSPGGYLAALGAGALMVFAPLAAAEVISAAFRIDCLALHFLFGLAEFAAVAGVTVR